MGRLNFPALQLGNNKGVVEEGVFAAPGVVAIPKMENGQYPKFLYLATVLGTSRAWVTVTPTLGGNGAIATGLPLVTGNAGIILNVHGYTHIGTEGSTADCNLHLYPLEDF